MVNKMDHWYEEDEEVFVHPRDPYHRVDILESSRHVKVRVNGEIVAQTQQPKILFETGLPPRYYIPPEDVREDVLIPSEKSTRCPYKGIASYWSVEVGGESGEPRLELRGPYTRSCQDKGAFVLLQREGGLGGGWRGAGAA
jgi:uncharacterized protein (DUF427 family)